MIKRTIAPSRSCCKCAHFHYNNPTGNQHTYSFRAIILAIPSPKGGWDSSRCEVTRQSSVETHPTRNTQMGRMYWATVESHLLFPSSLLLLNPLHEYCASNILLWCALVYVQNPAFHVCASIVDIGPCNITPTARNNLYHCYCLHYIYFIAPAPPTAPYHQLCSERPIPTPRSRQCG